jgi:hypothetical protein
MLKQCMLKLLVSSTSRRARSQNQNSHSTWICPPTAAQRTQNALASPNPLVKHQYKQVTD